MQKFILLVLFSFLTIVSPSSVRGAAVVDDPFADTRQVGFQCLNFVRCHTQGGPFNCPPGDREEGTNDQITWDHRARIYTDPATSINPPAGAKTFIVDCVQFLTPNGGWEPVNPICTTGSSRTDQELFCGDPNSTNPNCDHYKQLHGLSYRMNGDADFPNHGIVQSSFKHYNLYYSNVPYYNYTSEQNVRQIATHFPSSTLPDGTRQIKTVEIQGGKTPLVEWQAFTPPGREALHRYYAMWSVAAPPVPATPTATPTPARAAVGTGGQQQDTLTFKVATPTPTTVPPLALPDNCQSAAWDPYGRVFDTATLEPIPQSQIVLLQKQENSDEFSRQYASEQNLFISNPYATLGDGSFNFQVEPGEYQLQVTRDQYTHPARGSLTLLPNTLQIYSDIYYQDSPPIVQTGALQHRDIPLQPTNGSGHRYPIHILEQKKRAELQNNAQVLEFSGRVSHPFADANVYTCIRTEGVASETCNLLQTYTTSQGAPDKNGEFTLLLDQASLLEGGRFRVEFVKKDLTQQNLSNSLVNRIISWIQSFTPFVVHAQEDENVAEVYVDPILAYMEGYAYDANGNIMPNALVGLYTPLAPTAVYSQYADENGYYKITSEHIPKMEFSIRYTIRDGADNLITTHDYLVQNQSFIQAEGIDVFTYVTEATNPRRDVIPSFVPEQKVAPAGANPVATPSDTVPEVPSAETARNPIFLVGAILLLLLGGAGVLLAVYVYRKRSQQQI